MGRVCGGYCGVRDDFSWDKGKTGTVASIIRLTQGSALAGFIRIRYEVTLDLIVICSLLEKSG